MKDALKAELAERIGHPPMGRVLIVTGSGVSIAATANNPLASWKGLVTNGVVRCNELGLCDEEWVGQQRKALDGDLKKLLSVASQVSDRLGWKRRDPCDGNWSGWLRQTVGSLRAQKRELIEAICDLGVSIATLNYDDLLEEITGLRPLTWQQVERWPPVLDGKDRKILHLHGHWETPSSVVLGIRSYDAMLGDQRAQHLQKVVATTHSLLFIGCGGTFKDPNFTALVAWMREHLSGFEHHHYLLLPRGEPPAVAEDLLRAAHIMPVLYGDRHNLPTFIRDLAAGHPDAKRRRGSSNFEGRWRISNVSNTLSKLETLQYRVSIWDGHWDNADGRALYQECKRFVDKLVFNEDRLADYAVLLEGYLLNKGGPLLIAENSSRIGILARQAAKRSPEGAAASWQLARIYLAQESQAEQLQRQRELFKAAAELFSRIGETIQLAYPVLLPGIRSESPEDRLIFDDPLLTDPRTQVLPIPHRYSTAVLADLANAHLTLAEKSSGQATEHISKALSLFERAKHISTRAATLIDSDSPHVVLDLELVELRAATYHIMRLPSRQRKNDVVDHLHQLIEKIERQTGRLPFVKTLEWTGNCQAAIAYLSDSPHQHDDSLSRLHEYIARIGQLALGRSDWLTMDAIYGMAHATQEEKAQFRQLLNVTWPSPCSRRSPL